MAFSHYAVIDFDVCAIRACLRMSFEIRKARQFLEMMLSDEVPLERAVPSC